MNLTHASHKTVLSKTKVRPVLKPGSYNERMILLDMLGAAKRQNNSMLCFGQNLEPAIFPNKLKGDGSRIYGSFAANVDSVANLVSA